MIDSFFLDIRKTIPGWTVVIYTKDLQVSFTKPTRLAAFKTATSYLYARQEIHNGIIKCL